MKIEDIELEVILGENTVQNVAKAFFKLYNNNAYKILDIEDIDNNKIIQGSANNERPKE